MDAAGVERRRRALAALTALVALVPVVLVLPAIFDRSRMIDLEVYRQGGRAVLAGAGLYGDFVHSHTVSPPLDFSDPPVAALLALPLDPAATRRRRPALAVRRDPRSWRAFLNLRPERPQCRRYAHTRCVSDS